MESDVFFIPCFVDLNLLSPETAGAGFAFLQYCNLNSLRTKFILSISLFLGLSIPQYFRVYEMFFGFGPVHTHSVAVCELDAIDQTNSIKLSHSHLFLLLAIAVQCDGQCHLLIAGYGGRHTGLPSGLHPPVLGSECEEGQGLVLVGEVQVLQV